MQIWLNLLFILQILAAVTMIGLVLLQHGKGADMGASFGSGASGSLFGATGSANFLSRSTAICATVFFVTTIGMGMLSTGRFASVHPTTSVNRLDNALAVPAPASAPAVTGAPAVASAPASGASAAASAVQGIPQR